jgi:molybdopterin/thiamine biosynthesis adenylyltransferase
VNFEFSDAHRARILDSADINDRRVLMELRSDPRIEYIDEWHRQLTTAQEILGGPSPVAESATAPRHWAYYPWRRAVVAVLDAQAFRRVRLDRNRNIITAEEQQKLGKLRIGVVGLSVGHAVAHTLAAEGLCGELRLADFDHLELTNLNRVPATVFDLGVNKATVAARRIAELDPYLHVQVQTTGLTAANVDAFLDGLDLVVEECDSLDMKAIVREAARLHRLPVLMATSDCGLVDVERFDLEPGRPILHGLLGDLDASALADLPSRDKVPHVLRILDAGRLSARGAASMIEVGHTLSTWPQMAGDVALGATAIAEAVRRIGLGKAIPSGRVRIDVATALDHLSEPELPPTDHRLAREYADPLMPVELSGDFTHVVNHVVAAAVRAPSAGNAQPWHVEADPDSITLRLSPRHMSTVDIGFRGSAVAVGAAVFNVRVAAAACGFLGAVELGRGDGQAPLHAVIRLAEGEDPGLARLYQPMLLRETNRHRGTAGFIDAETIRLLESAARREGARLQLLTARSDIDQSAAILAATDRIRYLTPRLHAEMIAELRWPGDPYPESGIDVHSLELDSGELAILDILRRPDVMACLAEWDAGVALGDYTRDRVRASSALAVVTVQGQALIDYARGGSALEAVWIVAQQSGLAVQPVSPVFLYAHNQGEVRELSTPFATELHHLQQEFRELAGTTDDESQVIVLRFCEAQPTSVRSRRRLGEIRAN